MCLLSRFSIYFIAWCYLTFLGEITRYVSTNRKQKLSYTWNTKRPTSKTRFNNDMEDTLSTQWVGIIYSSKSAQRNNVGQHYFQHFRESYKVNHLNLSKDQYLYSIILTMVWIYEQSGYFRNLFCFQCLSYCFISLPPEKPEVFWRFQVV